LEIQKWLKVQKEAPNGLASSSWWCTVLEAGPKKRAN